MLTQAVAEDIAQGLFFSGAYHSAGVRIDQVYLPAGGANHGLDGQRGNVVLVTFNLKPSLCVHARGGALVH